MLDYKNIENGDGRSTHDDFHNRLSESIDKLSAKIDVFGAKVDSFLEYSNNSIPHKVVYLIFILIFSLIFGIEGMQFFFKTWLPKLVLQ